MIIIIFTLIWGIALFIFLVYSLISLLFRMISYPRDFHYFAGNQQPAKIDYNLQYYNIMLLFHVLMRQQLFNEQSNVCCDLSNLKDASSDNSVSQIKQITNSHVHLLRRHLLMPIQARGMY